MQNLTPAAESKLEFVKTKGNIYTKVQIVSLVSESTSEGASL